MGSADSEDYPNEKYAEILRHAMRKDFKYSESDSDTPDSEPKVRKKGKIPAEAIRDVGPDQGEGIESEQKLRDIYYNVLRGYRSAEKLYQEAKKDGLDISRNAVSRWLNNYNNSINRSIKKRPADVTENNESEVWTTLYGHLYSNLPEPKFKIGQTVRISKYKTIFTKGYEANFTEEVFIVKRVKISPDGIIVYKLEDKESEPILGSFYEWELSSFTEK